MASLTANDYLLDFEMLRAAGALCIDKAAKTARGVRIQETWQYCRQRVTGGEAEGRQAYMTRCLGASFSLRGFLGHVTDWPSFRLALHESCGQHIPHRRRTSNGPNTYVPDALTNFQKQLSLQMTQTSSIIAFS